MLLEGQQKGNPIVTILLFVGLFAIMFVPMFLRGKKEKKEAEKTQSSLAVGAVVMTAGGIKGKLVEVTDTDIVIETGSEEHKSCVRIVRYAIR